MPEGGRLAIGTEVVELTAADILDGEALPSRYVAISVAAAGRACRQKYWSGCSTRSSPPSRRTRARGWGRASVWGFMRQSGGLVRIVSTPGRGTTVRLLLPLHEDMVPDDMPARSCRRMPRRSPNLSGSMPWRGGFKHLCSLRSLHSRKPGQGGGAAGPPVTTYSYHVFAAACSAFSASVLIYSSAL